MTQNRRMDRRMFLAGGIGLAAGSAGFLGLDWASRSASRPTLAHAANNAVLLDAAESEIDLGGRTVTTWAYGGQVPGRELRATAGKMLDVRLRNHLPVNTTVHWHGLRIANAMDGVPDVTQPSVRPETEFLYRFSPPDPGTYWLHSHEHLQLDRGLYAPLIIEDPRERLFYDDEWVIVLDDWVDGTGQTPEHVLEHLKEGGHGSHGMNMGGMDTGEGGGHHMNKGGMDMGSHHMTMDGCLRHLGEHLSDVDDYAYYLVNGRTPTSPMTFHGRPGQRIRMRIINAAADTFFQVALGDHTFTVTHTDGFPVRPQPAHSVLLGMAERIDAIVTLRDGVFPLVARAAGRNAAASAVVRTGSGPPPPRDAHPSGLDTCPLLATDLMADDDVVLNGPTDRRHTAVLSGDMDRFVWRINGEVFDDHTPLPVRRGEGVHMEFVNNTTMPHPMHLHGHTFQVVNRDGRPGPRKDTVIVPAMQRLDIYFTADNPGDWVLHCHNDYHMTAGMMTTVAYLT